jgi:hypothetical protein
VKQALAYALEGSCDSHVRTSAGVTALAAYAEVEGRRVSRFTVAGGAISVDELGEGTLSAWVDGRDPATGEARGRVMASPAADLVLDGTINAPKSFSIATLLHPELAEEFEALQDRLRDRVIRSWASELNARRGAGGRVRESLSRIEVVELRHRRSRALDPHVHRHLWLGVKVRGVDGAWSNVDSRVAMRFHTVVNAEGELAARTDPRWLAALARHGYTVNADGEIAELVHVVKPLSRRSAQIEANRALLLTQWQHEHAGRPPSPDDLRSIDRRAWALGRPNKPGRLDENDWERLIRDELRALDPNILDRHPGKTITLEHGRIEDIAGLAARAVLDADQRSTACGGKFSMFDLRAGAMRAVAACGLVAARDELQTLIDHVTGHAARELVDFLAEEDAVPQHVKGFMASATALLKSDLAMKLEQLASPGTRIPRDTIAHLAQRTLEHSVQLSKRQVDAAGAIAGTDRLVSVAGPAGSGKTAMLRVASAALLAQRRRLMIVAPTKKAASVAAREVGTETSSLHALLHDHGWRWTRDAAGAELWTCLQLGDPDPDTAGIYKGPRRYPIAAGDRIVVDEAGMVDLHTANALLDLAAETRVGIAMVGDHLQAMPVGHAGAMALLTRHATATVELDTVHRFQDPSYAALTLRMRTVTSEDEANEVAAALDAGGHLLRVDNADQGRIKMVDAYLAVGQQKCTIALVTGTNEEADAINEDIQTRRVQRGELDARRVAIGMGEQRILEGDVVQTRRNDHTTGVENRARWVVDKLMVDRIRLRSLSDPLDTRTVTTEYAAEAMHLAYASTVHGIQGETTTTAIVGPGVDAAGLYVGMTRGRNRNLAVVIATTDESARRAVAESLRRGRPEITLDESRHAAATDLSRSARPLTPTPTAVPRDSGPAPLRERNSGADIFAPFAPKRARSLGR